MKRDKILKILKKYHVSYDIAFDLADELFTSLQGEQEQNINYNFAIFDISKIYQFTIQDINTNEIIMIDEDTERKAFRKASRYLGEQELRDRELKLISKRLNKKK